MPYTFKKAEKQPNKLTLQQYQKTIKKYMNITNKNNQLNNPDTQPSNNSIQTELQSFTNPITQALIQKSSNLNQHTYQHSVEIIKTQPKLTQRQRVVRELEEKEKDEIQQKMMNAQQHSNMEVRQNTLNNIETNMNNVGDSLQKQEEQHKDNEQKSIKLNKKIKKQKKPRTRKNNTEVGNHSQNSYSHSEQNQNLLNNNQIQEQNYAQNYPYNSIICQLCQQPLVFAMESICGHAFCEYCLLQYLLISTCCPTCGLRIRQRKGATNKKLDEIVEQFCIHMGKQAYQQLKERKQYRKKLKQDRRVTNLYSGLEIDVRDDDYVWKKGRIIRTFNRISAENVRLKFIIIQYLQNYKKQQFSSNCPRIAKSGYYTNRTQIPRNSLQIYMILQEQKIRLQKSEVKMEPSQDQQQEGYINEKMRGLQQKVDLNDQKQDYIRNQKGQQQKFQHHQ